MRVAVTGATGAIGGAVVRLLRERGDAVVAVSRNPGAAEIDAMSWDELDLSGFDGVIHLAGEPLDQRWTDATKERIRSSRVDTTRRVVEALGRAEPRPRVLVSQSAEGIYREDGFLPEVVRAWEAEARKAEGLGVRVAITRTGVVLTRTHGALKKMLLPFKLGVGGPVAGGRQPFPWIHLDDAARALVFCLDDERVSGPLDVVAPQQVDNREYSKALGRALHRPAVLPVPGFALSLLYGEMGQMVTGGSVMTPERLLELGFEFRYADVDSALSAEL
jgi:uncharacterized protein (TIGR01777 family)